MTPIQNLYLSSQIRGEFDTVIVDEASMANPVHVMLAGGAPSHAPSWRAIFANCPAPVVHPKPMEVPWLARDIFQAVGIVEDVEREDDPPYMAMLDRAVSNGVADLRFGERALLYGPPPQAPARPGPTIPGWRT